MELKIDIVNKKLIVKNVFKVFGENPKKALKMLKNGESKEEIFTKTGMTIGVQDASFERYHRLLQ